MSSDWISVTVPAFVGLAGIASTYFTARESRRAQQESMQDTFNEARERESMAHKRTLYARFLSAAREFDMLASIQGVVDANAAKVADELIGLAPPDANPGLPDETWMRARRQEVIQKVQQKVGIMSPQESWTRLSSLVALQSEVGLIAGESVRAAMQAVLECAPWTLHADVPMEEPREAQGRLMGRRIGELARVMATELAGA